MVCDYNDKYSMTDSFRKNMNFIFTADQPNEYELWIINDSLFVTLAAATVSDMSCWHGAQQQTHCTAQLQANDE